MTGWRIKMEKLKTLKELEFWKAPNIDKELSVEWYRLQELGTNWIKAFQKGECHTDFAADGRNGQENIIEWIQHVFNISDEDLEEKKEHTPLQDLFR
jgi:hypothetical protein